MICIFRKIQIRKDEQLDRPIEKSVFMVSQPLIYECIRDEDQCCRLGTNVFN